MKVALKQLRSPFKKLQQYRRIKNLRITAPSGKKKHLYFPCIIPFPWLALGSTKKELLCWRRVPLEMGVCWGQPASQPFKVVLKGRTSVSPHPDTSDAETCRDAWDKEEGRGYQYDPHSSSILLFEYMMPAYIPYSWNPLLCMCLGLTPPSVQMCYLQSPKHGNNLSFQQQMDEWRKWCACFYAYVCVYSGIICNSIIQLLSRRVQLFVTSWTAALQALT